MHFILHLKKLHIASALTFGFCLLFSLFAYSVLFGFFAFSLFVCWRANEQPFVERRIVNYEKLHSEILHLNRMNFILCNRLCLASSSFSYFFFVRCIIFLFYFSCNAFSTVIMRRLFCLCLCVREKESVDGSWWLYALRMQNECVYLKYIHNLPFWVAAKNNIFPSLIFFMALCLTFSPSRPLFR